MIRWLMAATVLGATPVAAQQDSLMLEAIRLATEGQSDSARVIVRAKLLALSPQDPEYTETLFTAGMVADSAAHAVRYFRQVSIEHSSSAWADRALLRLAQLAFAAGDLRAVRRSAERVLLDYPLSEVRAQAAFWAGRAGLDLNEPTAACRFFAQAEREAGDNVELANRAAFYLQRCTNGLGVTPADSSVADSAPAEPPAGRTVFAVQVVAVSTAAAADQAMRELRAEGYNARVFRDEDGLLKVRVGRFSRRRDADALLRELRNRVGGRPFVVEERP